MTTDEKLDLILKKVSSLDEKVSVLDEKVSVLDEKLSVLDERVSSLDERVSSLDERVSSLEISQLKMQASIDKMEKDISGIKCTLEGETNYNIKLIAEGHAYANEHSSDALHIAHQVKASQELQDIRLNIIESEIKRIQGALQSA